MTPPWHAGTWQRRHDESERKSKNEKEIMLPVGFKEIRLNFDFDTDATEEQVATLLRLTERYCVVYQTLSHPAKIEISHRAISR
jgi:uncharacterized OsmC-like protein